MSPKNDLKKAEKRAEATYKKLYALATKLGVEWGFALTDLKEKQERGADLMTIAAAKYRCNALKVIIDLNDAVLEAVTLTLMELRKLKAAQKNKRRRL